MTITAAVFYQALSGTVMNALAAAGLPAQALVGEIQRPVMERQVKIDLTSSTVCGDGEQVEHSYDAQIHLYPRDADPAQEECLSALTVLSRALRAGLKVNGYPIELLNGVHAKMVGGELTVTLTAAWLETADEDGQPMEELIYEEEF